MFDNSYFDNSVGFVEQVKNGLFQVNVLVQKSGNYN